VILGQAAECLQSVFTALNTAALAVEDFLNTLAEFLFPIGILGFWVIVIQGADAVPIWLAC
jgi:hypothetical protein